MTEDRSISPAVARTHSIRGHHPFVLDEAGSMWVVRTGSAAVFAARIEDGAPVGERRFIGRIGSGESLMGVRASDSSIRLMALAIEDLTLAEHPLEGLHADDLIDGIPLSTRLEEWTSRLSSFIGNDSGSAEIERITEPGEVVLDAGQRARSERDRVFWFSSKTGRVILLGAEGLEMPPSTSIPLGSGAWFEALAPATLTAVGADELDSGQMLEGLEALHGLVSAQLEFLDASERDREVRRLQQRGVMQANIRETALDEMAAVLNPRTLLPHRDTNLLSTVAAVGHALGIEIRPPATSENLKRVKDPLDAIARASRVRHRRVLLRGRWWNNDCGPLVGYLSDGHRPIALLRTRTSQYEIVDPETRKRTIVDDLTSGLLDPEAVMIYRPLPDRALRAWHLIGFSMRGRGGDAVFILGLSVLVSIIGMLTPMATALVLDTAIPDSNQRLLLELGLGLIAASVGLGLLSLAQGVVAIRMSVATDAVTQAALWDRLLSLRPSFFKRFSSGDLLSRASAVGDITRELNGTTLGTMLSGLMAALNLGLLIYYSASLAWIAVAMALVTGGATVVGGYFIRRYNVALLEMSGEFFGLVTQLISSVSKIRVAGAEERAFALWVRKYSQQLVLIQKSQGAEDYVVVVNQAVPTISTILLFWFGVELLTGSGPEGRMSVGIFLAFNTALAIFVAGMTSLGNAFVQIVDTLAKSKRIVPILEAESEANESKADPGRLAGSVAFSHIHFRYSDDGPMILDDVNLTAEPGEFVAIVGPSGSGKSTLFRLLLGFEFPESGVISYDGQDLVGLDITAVRRQLGTVLQSGVLNAGSIFENIGAGAFITLDEAWEAAEDSGLADDIRAMPMGMHTMVSEGGGNFSGGQRQRLLITRSIVTRPSILLMDEATSALDNRTQAIVSESLERRKVTRLVIAHRLSTIQNADRIYVLDRGLVVQTGTFEDLSNREGVFASLMARQQT